MSPVVPDRADRTTVLRRATAVVLAAVVIALGLSLRFFGLRLGLPVHVVKYGGSILWATMLVCLLVAILPQQPRRRLALIALVIALIVELSRLLHTPWLDGFRLTLAGALLLGRIFSVWNIVAYAAGIVLGVWIFYGRIGDGAKHPCSRAVAHFKNKY
jgi:hypothetical protein